MIQETNKNQHFSYSVLGAEAIPAIVALEQLNFTLPWTKEQYEKLFASGVCKLFGILVNAKLVAYASFLAVPDSDAELCNIAVQEELRRNGLARMLLTNALKDRTFTGLERVILEVRGSNVAAVALYVSLGFQLCGRRKNYYTSPVEDALVYEMYLPKSI